MKHDLSNLISSLVNWKFETAMSLLPSLHSREAMKAAGLLAEIKEEDRKLIFALGSLLGNPGWFDGHMGTIVTEVVDGLVERLRKFGAGKRRKGK